MDKCIWSRMKSKKLIQDLEDIMKSELLNYSFPSISADSIRIKNYSVGETKQGFTVYHRKKPVASTYFKKSAIAIAKCLSEDDDQTAKILELDDLASKYYTDLLIFQNTLKKNTQKEMIESRRARISKTARHAAYYTKQIEKFVYKR